MGLYFGPFPQRAYNSGKSPVFLIREAMESLQGGLSPVYISIRTFYEQKSPYKRKSPQCFKRMLSAMPCYLCATGGTSGKNKEKRS